MESHCTDFLSTIECIYSAKLPFVCSYILVYMTGIAGGANENRTPDVEVRDEDNIPTFFLCIYIYFLNAYSMYKYIPSNNL